MIPDTVLMLLCGLASHFLKDLIRVKSEKGKISIKKYWMDNPYQNLLCVVGAVAGYVALESTGQLTVVTSFGVGYVANSVADMIGKRSLEKL